MTIHAPSVPDDDHRSARTPLPPAPAAAPGDPEQIVVEVPVAVPTWAAGNAAWWAISVVVAALAIALLTLLRTASAFSDAGPAEDLLAAVLRAPTEAAAESALAATPDADRQLSVRDDLVAFDLSAAALRSDFAGTVDAAIDERVDELRTDGIPVDPGADRTQTGVPRQLIESLSEENHDVVERGVLLSAVLAGALLLFTLLQGRNDNLLMLPAGALAVAWVFVTISLQLLRMVLDGTGPGAPQVIRIIEDAAAQPRQQLTFAVFAAVLGGAMYRLLNQWQGWRRQRALERYRASVADASDATDLPDAEAPPVEELIDLVDDEIVLVGPSRIEVPSDAATSARPIPVRLVRRRESTLSD